MVLTTTLHVRCSLKVSIAVSKQIAAGVERACCWVPVQIRGHIKGYTYNTVHKYIYICILIVCNIQLLQGGGSTRAVSRKPGCFGVSALSSGQFQSCMGMKPYLRINGYIHTHDIYVYILCICIYVHVYIQYQI